MKLSPEQIKPALRDCISFQLANKKNETLQETETTAAAIKKAFEKIPQVKFIQQAQYIKNVLLPKIEQTRGVNSTEYQFHYSVFESLMYSIVLCDRDQSLRLMISNEKILNEFLQKRLAFYQTELQKYTTLENLTVSELTAELTTKNSIINS